jgi:hypothetical protein
MEDSKCRYSICVCQRFKAQDRNDECLYCSHSIGFHEIPFSNINIEEHPYGKCLGCNYCQRYKEGSSNKCVYCGHFQGFHLSWSATSTTISSSSKPPISPTRKISNAGRPVADSITIKYLVLLSSNKLPKKGTDVWNTLMNKGHIKENVTISKADNVLNKFRNLFGINDQRVKLKLYSPKRGKPVEINDVSNKIFFKLYLYSFIKFENFSF